MASDRMSSTDWALYWELQADAERARAHAAVLTARAFRALGEEGTAKEFERVAADYYASAIEHDRRRDGELAHIAKVQAIRNGDAHA